MPGDFEQRIGADDIVLHEIARSIDRPIHMRFSCQMHDVVRLHLGKHTRERRAVANIGLDQLKSWIIFQKG